MGRRLAIAGGLTLAVLLALWARGGRLDFRTESTATSRAPVARDKVVRIIETSVSDRRMADFEVPFVAEIDGIAASCGLDVRSTCADGVCVALTRVPDLDAFGGWLAFVQMSPWFVAGTVARDLGLPRGMSGCGAALAGLTGQATSVALPGGDELWCAAPDGSPAARALCGQAAAAWFDVDAAAWSSPDLRVLRF